MDAILVPALLATLSAALFGWNAHVQRKGLADCDPTTGALLSVGTSAVLCWILAPFFIDPAWFLTPQALLFGAVGIFFPALGQYLQVRGVGLVGPSLTASLGALTPVFSITLGIVWLGETMNLQAVLGLLLTLASLVLATWSPKGIKRNFALIALLVPIGAALARGLAQPALRFGFQDLPSPFFALLMASSVSTLLLGALVLKNRAAGKMRVGPGARHFALAGLINGVGIFSLNGALSLGVLALVSPIAATTPLWTLLLGVTFYRSAETLGWRHLIIALMVVAGAVLIVTH